MQKRKISQAQPNHHIVRYKNYFPTAVQTNESLVAVRTTNHIIEQTKWVFECKVCVHLYKCRSHNGVKYFPMSQWNRVFILIDFKKRVNLCCFSSIASTLQRFALCSPVQLSSHMQMYVRIECQMLFRMLIILHLNDVWFYSFEPKHTQSVNCTWIDWKQKTARH